MCPRMQTPGGGVWAGTPPCGKTPPGPALHLNGRRDRRPLAGRARAQGAPADLPRLDRCSPAGHLEGLQAEGARPRRICRDTAKESRPAGRTPGPPPRATSTPDRASAAPLPAPEGLQADTAGRLDLSAAVEAGPDAASTPAATRAAGGNCATPGHKMQPEGQQTDTAQATSNQPAAGPSWTPQHGEPCPLRIWANGHTSACAPVPAPAQDLPGRTGPALPPQQGKGRRRHGPARPAGHLNARADPAAIVSAAASQRHPWTRGAGPPAGHLNADSWRGTKKAPNPQKWCVIWCVKTLTC